MTLAYFEWNGEAMVPCPGSRQRCGDHFAVHEVYEMEVREPRSAATHNHYFAALHDAWQNLPEDQAERFASSEHLRKWCLIKAGYRDERSFACASNAEALRLAAFLKPFDEYAVIVVREAAVIAYTAKSQSMRAMGKKDFQASKDAVLGLCATMIGVEPGQLQSEAGRAA